MKVPQLPSQQVSWITAEVAGFIARQREHYRRRAAPLSLVQNAAMQPFFPEHVLQTTRLLTLVDSRVPNPNFYPKLLDMGLPESLLPDFATVVAAVTFQDVVVSHERFVHRLLFHELVHAVQYQKLGKDEFARLYVRGFLQNGSYDGIPLEVNAYRLDARFARQPSRPFSVEAEVQAWIDNGKF